ncbi:Uncharacterised protein [Mycobacteroides abscessus]|nr:Uncharacterised protein [Mycobacteroides abscessus]
MTYQGRLVAASAGADDARSTSNVSTRPAAVHVLPARRTSLPR